MKTFTSAQVLTYIKKIHKKGFKLEPKTGMISLMDQDIGHCVPELLEGIKGKGDGHQREILKILLKSSFNERYLTTLFDLSLDIWLNIKKKSSLRITAYQILIKITNRPLFPECGFVKPCPALAYSVPDRPKAAKHLPKELELQFSIALVLFIKLAFLCSSA